MARVSSWEILEKRKSVFPKFAQLIREHDLKVWGIALSLLDPKLKDVNVKPDEELKAEILALRDPVTGRSRYSSNALTIGFLDK